MLDMQPQAEAARFAKRVEVSTPIRSEQFARIGAALAPILA